ncbi:MAG: RagB/SusD family nutrient uptake outer membrane protein [Tannerellaceae bacterium]|nr:RagB/SusD family nutrient uptake outer membrane protein [Tannerellaceae bacterium]
MNTYIKFTVSLLACLLVGCNDDFMDRFPKTTINPEVSFQTTNDLELYTNTYYSKVSPEWFDYVCDNYVSYAESHSNNDMIRNAITPATVTGWSKDTWGDLRKYNYFLENVHRAEGDPAIINHHIGLTRVERAKWYYQMVIWYNDVPWYSRSLTDADEDLLFKKQDPRTLVVDSIMADLDFAVKHISEDMGNRTQFSKWYAYAIMARICLHEGTHRKYHTDLGLQNTANEYLRKAVEATTELMKSGLFGIDKTGGPELAYWQLFNGYDLSKSPEVILYKDYDQEARIMHSAGRYSFDWVANFSRSLMESYHSLTPDGKAVPFSTLPDYDKKTFVEVFENRDPRFRQTFMYPGYTVAGQTQPNRPNMNLGGYPVIKYMAGTIDQLAGGTQYTDLPYIRYAEMLLIRAEAKAELGELTQQDMDETINEIRSRVDMPPIILGQIVEDPQLKAQFPGITDLALLEIRRERRIKLVCENFRWEDLMRWKAGHLLEQVQEGIYVPEFGLIDVTGENTPTIGIYEDAESNPIPEEDRGNYTFYYLKGANGALNTFSLSNGTSGHIVINGEIGSRTFKQSQYYYWPIPVNQITLNPNLEQTIYWK